MTATHPLVDTAAQTLLDLQKPNATPDIPFPLDAFPPQIAAWIESTAKRARVPVSFVAIPFLAFTGSLVGRQIALEVSPGWIERPTLWVAIVSPTGLGKTPALSAAREPFWRIHHEIWQEWHDWRTKTHGFRVPPRPPIGLLFTTATGMGQIAAALDQAPGVCLLRDELYGLIRNLDRNQGEGRQGFLSLWSSEPIIPVRPDLAGACGVAAPVVGIVGGLQPSLLERVRRREQDGFLERFLLVYPPGQMERWSEDDISGIPVPDTGAIVDLLRPLRRIPEAAGHPEGFVIKRTPGTGTAWQEWFNGNIDQHHRSNAEIAAYYRKLPSHLARIALVLNILWNPSRPTSPLDEATMRHAIALVEYLRRHEHRTGSVLGIESRLRTPERALTERILSLLLKADPKNPVTRTELVVALGRPDTAAFDRCIQHLESASIITTETVPTGGRPSTRYRVEPQRRARPKRR